MDGAPVVCGSVCKQWFYISPNRVLLLIKVYRIEPFLLTSAATKPHSGSTAALCHVQKFRHPKFCFLGLYREHTFNTHLMHVLGSRDGHFCTVSDFRRTHLTKNDKKWQRKKKLFIFIAMQSIDTLLWSIMLQMQANLDLERLLLVFLNSWSLDYLFKKWKEAPIGPNPPYWSQKKRYATPVMEYFGVAVSSLWYSLLHDVLDVFKHACVVSAYIGFNMKGHLYRRIIPTWMKRGDSSQTRN